MPGDTFRRGWMESGLDLKERAELTITHAAECLGSGAGDLWAHHLTVRLARFTGATDERMERAWGSTPAWWSDPDSGRTLETALHNAACLWYTGIVLARSKRRNNNATA